jgi:hypothetical protein
LLSERAFWTGPGVGSGVFINRNLAFRVQRIQANFKFVSYPEAGPVAHLCNRTKHSPSPSHPSGWAARRGRVGEGMGKTRIPHKRLPGFPIPLPTSPCAQPTRRGVKGEEKHRRHSYNRPEQDSLTAHKTISQCSASDCRPARTNARCRASA